MEVEPTSWLSGAMEWLAVLVLGVLALRRISKLEKRIDGLERAVAAGTPLAQIDGAAPAAATVAVATPPAPSPPPVEVAQGIFLRPDAMEELGAPVPDVQTADRIDVDVPRGDIVGDGVPTSDVAATDAITGASPAPDESAGTAPPPRRPAYVPPPPPPELPSLPAIDWERWIGVQGAALAGGIVLALAGVLLFKYSIEQGLISPAVRVIGATIVGLACIVAAQLPRWRENYESTANALAGAGVVVLYAAFWAAKALYGFIGMPVAFTLMSLVTASCCLLSIRHDSKFIALLGLVGGFLTPLMISSGSDRPLGLFGYILVLDVAFLELARRQRWSLIAPLSLAGTVLLQLLWISMRMGPDRLWIGLGVLAIFALLYGVYGERARATEGGDDDPLWAGSQTAALISPLLFIVYFAARSELTPHLWPLGLMLVLLSAAASWVGSKHRDPLLGLAAAGGSVAVVTVWVARQTLTTPLAWEAVGVSGLLALLFQMMAERDEGEMPRRAALVTTGAPFIVTILASTAASYVSPWPWLVGWVALAALLVRQATWPEQQKLFYAAAAGLGAGIGLLHLVQNGMGFSSTSQLLAVLVGAGVLGRVTAHLLRERPYGAAADTGAAVLGLLLLAPLAVSDLRLAIGPVLFFGATLLLGLLVLMAAASNGRGYIALAATVLTAFVQTSWAMRLADAMSFVETIPRGFEGGLPDYALHGLAMAFVSVLVFAAWPLVARTLRDTRPAWWASALAAPLWFPMVMVLWEKRFGDGISGLPPLVLSTITLAAAALGRRRFDEGSPRQVSVLAWYLGVTLGFVSVAIPLQLEKEWITIGWALEGVALLVLWRRLDHPGLKWFALALLAAVTVRLVGNAELLQYHERTGWRILNWVLYTYMVPAGCLLAAANLLQPLELSRAREPEQFVYQHGHPVGAYGCGLAALVVVFVWINLAIADWFSTGPYLTVSFERMPARDLTTSIAWALYALVLLGVGLARGLSALRWVSLAVLLITLAKVFLYDLGELRDLYRVASLAGLAFSLILVSLAYQRFVFRKPPAEEAG